MGQQFLITISDWFYYLWSNQAAGTVIWVWVYKLNQMARINISMQGWKYQRLMLQSKVKKGLYLRFALKDRKLSIIKSNSTTSNILRFNNVTQFFGWFHVSGHFQMNFLVFKKSFFTINFILIVKNRYIIVSNNNWWVMIILWIVIFICNKDISVFKFVLQ